MIGPPVRPTVPHGSATSPNCAPLTRQLPCGHCEQTYRESGTVTAGPVIANRPGKDEVDDCEPSGPLRASPKPSRVGTVRGC